MARESSAVSLWIKYALFFINFVVWLLSVAVTGLGAYILVLKHKVVHDAIDFFFDPSTVMCTAGSIAFVVSLLGWVGALREYTSCLRVYKWAVTLAFLAELVVTVFIFLFYFAPSTFKKLGLFPEDALRDAIRKYGVVDDEDMKELIDNMQESLECCGFSDDDTGFLDWNENEYFNCSGPELTNPEKCSVPPSCCNLKPGEMKNILCGRDAMQRTPSGTVIENAVHNPIYMRGCLKAVGEFINEHALVIGGIMLGILLPQMYMMYLARTLRDQVLIQRSKWGRPTLPTAQPRPVDVNQPPRAAQYQHGGPHTSYHK